MVRYPADADSPVPLQPAVQRVVDLAVAGMANAAIAAALELTPETVACYLTYGRRAGFQIPNNTERGLRLSLPADIEARLFEEAAVRDMRCADFVLLLLRFIVDDDLFDAVIDDEVRDAAE